MTARAVGPPVLMAALLSFSCKATPPAPDGGTVSAALQEGKALFEAGKLDAALAKLQESPSEPESLYYQGRVWAKMAEAAPVPTPPPAPSPIPKGWEPPPPPEFKPEEIEAARLYEQAIAARPDHGPAHLALAELLAPHAARLHEVAQEAATKKGGRRPTPSPTPPPPVDASVERVVRAYLAAVEGDPGLTSLDGLLRFARRVGRLDAEEGAYRELIRRVKERPEPHVRYGDFLVNEKKDPDAAVEQYRQALIWRAEDEATRAKVADIYLKMAADLYAKQQYSSAEVRLKEAEKYVTDRTSPQGLMLQDYQSRIQAIRRPTSR